MASKLIKKDSLSNTDTAWSGYTNRVGIQHGLLLEGQFVFPILVHCKMSTNLTAPAPPTNHKFVSFRNSVFDSGQPDSMTNDGGQVVSGRMRRSGSFRAPV